MQHGQCPDCAKLAAKNTWKALIQVRQKVSHKRTFLYLEQLILKHNAQKDTIAIKEVRDGLDFFYSSRSHALRMMDFLASVAPIKYALPLVLNASDLTCNFFLRRSNSSEQIISSDIHTSTANFKYTYSVEIVPICKDDLVCMPLKQARSQSNISPLTLCIRVGNSIQLLDPQTLQTCDIPAQIYWRSPFDSLASVTELIEFTVLDIEPDHTKKRGKFILADAQVALGGAFHSTNGDIARDDGMMDYESSGLTNQVFHTRTHLGAILQPGDTALGYFLTNSNYNSDHFATLPASRIPDIILVKKSYPNRRKKSKARNWKLRSIAKEAGEDGETSGARGAIGRMGGRDQKKVEQDYELFLRDLEEDPELRSGINLYKAPEVTMATPDAPERGAGRGKKKPQFAMDVDEVAPVELVKPEEVVVGVDEEESESDFPDIKLDELLEGFDEMTLGGGDVQPEEEVASI